MTYTPSSVYDYLEAISDLVAQVAQTVMQLQADPEVKPMMELHISTIAATVANIDLHAHDIRRLIGLPRLQEDDE